MEQQKIRIGILSTANIGKRSTIPAILALPDYFELVGIASRNLPAAELVAKEFNCEAFGTYEELLKKDLIDAVYIPLPNSLHHQWVKHALTEGIHVVVEKSLGCNLEEVKELTEIAEKNNLALLENFQFRFHPQLKCIQDQLASGKIGTLRYIRSSFEFPPFPDQTNIRYQKELSGGALLDAGAYPLKISQLFLGRDISVAASTLRYDNELGVDLGGGAFLKQNEGDLYSEVSFGFDNFYQCSIELFGTKGKISTNRIFSAPPGYSPNIKIEVSGPAETIELEPSNHFIHMLEHFYQVINSDTIRKDEYLQNVNQSRLIQELYNFANGK
ncbi:MAG: Gfo/Idh/MocA family oxidoreductase [Pedobacter sp.]|nr:MAG: Gfo/Idh/MocA family oxidoreductase [Pedobacter sp.]